MNSRDKELINRFKQIVEDTIANGSIMQEKDDNTNHNDNNYLSVKGIESFENALKDATLNTTEMINKAEALIQEIQKLRPNANDKIKFTHN